MGTKVNTAAAMKAYIDITVVVFAHRINRTGGNAFSTFDTLLLSDDHTAPRPLTEGTGRTSGNTWSRIAAQADLGNESR